MEYRNVTIYQTPPEQDVFRNEVQKTKNLDGDVAEVGVYQGATAMIIREELPYKKIYLLDTFEGFPEIHESEKGHFKVGQCATSEETVTKIFQDDNNVEIIKGVFPDTSKFLKDKKFSFVHLDTDIYIPTKTGLEFFYPRMVENGIIIVHDYPIHPGVKLAVDEWKKDKECDMVEGSWRQFIIYKNKK